MTPLQDFLDCKIAITVERDDIDRLQRFLESMSIKGFTWLSKLPLLELPTVQIMDTLCSPGMGLVIHYDHRNRMYGSNYLERHQSVNINDLEFCIEREQEEVTLSISLNET